LFGYNAETIRHTKKYKPWVVVFYTAFREFDKAAEFERYLKTFSGKAFIEKKG